MIQNQDKPESRLLVHIGYHKTGTTWLQSELFTPDSGTFVPLSLGNDPNPGKYLGKHFVRDREGYLLSPFVTNEAVIMEELDAALARIDAQGRIPVLSYERLSGNPHSGGFDAKTIADRIRACFPEARIFCVIREQRDMILSTYFQYLKIGGIDSLDNYLTRSYDGRRPGFSPDHFDYSKLVAYYLQLFSPENVLVLPYEMFRNHPGRYLQRLGDFVSADLAGLAGQARIFHNERAKNPIIPRFPFLNLVFGKSSVNAYSPLHIPLSESLVDAANRFMRAGRGAYIDKLKQQTARFVGDRFAAGNRKLSELTGLDLRDYGYYD